MSKFGHVENIRLRNYLEGKPDALSEIEALSYSLDCLMKDFFSHTLNEEGAPTLGVLLAREEKYDLAWLESTRGNSEGVRLQLQNMWLI